MSGSAPKAPDPWQTAQAQSQMNRETAITQHQLNMVDQYNPFGSVTNQQIGTWEDGTPRFQQTTSYSPEAQGIFDETLKTQQNLANLATQQSANLAQHLGNNFSFTNDDAAQWAYDLASPRILQQQGQNEAALRSTLAAKGIREGSAAWDSEMSRLTNANTDQLNQLALQGRGQAYNEAFNNYTAPINTITALMSGSQVGSPASASPATPQTAVANTDYSGLVQQNYKNQVDAYNAKAGGIGGLFGSAMGAFGQAGGIAPFFAGLSDARLKENIRRIGSTESGIPLYLYNFIGDDKPQIGVMAQELRDIMPEAVIELPSGFLAVNYAEVR